MKKRKTLLTTILLIFTLLMGLVFPSCEKEGSLTVSKAMEQVEATRASITQQYSYVEATITKYDEKAHPTSEMLLLVHHSDYQYYCAEYEYVPDEVNEGKTKKVMKYQWLIDRKEDGTFRITGEIGEELNREDISSERYLEYIDEMYKKMFEKALPDSKEELLPEKLEGGGVSLSNIIVFKKTDSLGVEEERSVKINRATDKVHELEISRSDKIYILYKFNYPMIGGAVKKTEIPKIV